MEAFILKMICIVPVKFNMAIKTSLWQNLQNQVYSWKKKESLHFYLLIPFACVSMYVYKCMYHQGCGDQIQVIGLGRKFIFTSLVAQPLNKLPLPPLYWKYFQFPYNISRLQISYKQWQTSIIGRKALITCKPGIPFGSIWYGVSHWDVFF